MGLSELKYNWVLVLTNDLLVVIFSNHHKSSFIFEKSDKLCHNVKKKKKKKKTEEKNWSNHMLLKCLENQHKWERTNNIAKIYAGLQIKKNSKLPFGNYQRKNGCQIQKCSCQIVQEQKLRLDPHLIDIVVWLLELNTFQRHPPVAAA